MKTFIVLNLVFLITAYNNYASSQNLNEPEPPQEIITSDELELLERELENLKSAIKKGDQEAIERAERNIKALKKSAGTADISDPTAIDKENMTEKETAEVEIAEIAEIEGIEGIDMAEIEALEREKAKVRKTCQNLYERCGAWCFRYNSSVSRRKLCRESQCGRFKQPQCLQSKL